MSTAGVPVVEGYHGEDQSLPVLKREAERIGYPIMIKAVRGGGGKGMRIALTASEFESQLDSAKREAMKSFGDDAMLLEKFVQEPRHVEVQIFGDHHGNYVHLFERDCSVQRRHQKIIEEAPAPGISESLRKELGEAAVRAARAVAYVGAGTVEFILDRYTHSFHFMEMNTRLQVEHPITEMITGTDLVEWQLKVAAGEKLPVSQDDIKLHGHAFEARIYAENPREGFLPGAGPLLFLQTPEAKPDVRIETGVRQGDEVSVYYDPMIAKLVVWGESRQDALQKLKYNLAAYNVAGLDTNINFLLDLAKHPAFAAGDVHTGFIEQHKAELFPSPVLHDHHVIQAVLSVVLEEELEQLQKEPTNPFVIERGFRLNHLLERNFKLQFDNKEIPVQITYISKKQYQIKIGSSDKLYNVSGSLDKSSLQCMIDGVIVKSRVVHIDNEISVFCKDGCYKFTQPTPKWISELEQLEGNASFSENQCVAPMPGVIDKVWITPGSTVKAGDSLLVLIAMKMEYVIRAPKDGKIGQVFFNQGDNVKKNAILIQYAES